MAMLKVFKYLKEDEYQALLKAAERKAYKPDAALIRQGEEQTDIFIIVQGEVKVQRDHDGFMVDLTHAGPGAIFGDMSYIEGQPASASVMAYGQETLVVIISHGQIHDFTTRDTGFAGRFYHSLAEILSRRLRETNDLVTDDANPDALWGNI